MVVVYAAAERCDEGRGTDVERAAAPEPYPLSWYAVYADVLVPYCADVAPRYAPAAPGAGEDDR